MDSTERVMKANEKEAMPPVFKKLNSLEESGHLEKEMCEDIRVMVAGYFFYRRGVEIMGARLGVRAGMEGYVGYHRSEKEEKPCLKPERMDYMEVGAKFGKSKSGQEQKPGVTKKFVEKWADKFDGIAQQGLIIDLDLIKQMLTEAGVKIKNKGG